jgi:Fur family ferric uptake transcriptional regulator
MNEIVETLRKAGHRVTLPRRAVVRVLLQAERWLSPEEILTPAREYCHSLSLVTVYRTLALLSSLDCVRRIHFENGCHGYARTELVHGHYAVCRDCHRVVEFTGSDALNPLLEQVEAQTGFLVESHMLELVGLCAACHDSE